MHLAGKTALVTGAARNIGRGIVRKLAAEGAAVAINYQTSAREADSLALEICRSGGRALAVQGDVADRGSAEAMVERVSSQLGPVDILVNNAAKFARGDLEDFDYSQMDPMRRTNVDGVVHMTRAVVPSMKQRRFGRIVNITSIGTHSTALPGTTFYSATKAAVALLTRRFAVDLGPYGITVNAVAPGFVVTDMVGVGRTEEEVRALAAMLASRAMVGRVGRPEDMAHAVAFLVSPDAGFITAQVLTVDGGRMDYTGHP